MIGRYVAVATLLAAALAEREHKVHNIILYPDKFSWCQTTPIQQVVASPGYEAVTIDNNICVGACYSYSIPRTQPAEPGELIGPYCDSCQPAKTKCYHVTLHADGKNPDGPQTFQKRVQIIIDCSCISCQKIACEDCEISDQTTVELPPDLFSNKTQEPRNEEIPELLFAQDPKLRPVHNATPTTQKHYASLLNSLHDSAQDDIDPAHLKNLLNMIKGPAHELTDQKLTEFMEFVNQTDNVSKLKDILGPFQKSQAILEKHREFGLGQAQKNNAQIEHDLRAYNLPPSYGLEGVPQPAPPTIKDTPKNHHLGEELHAQLGSAHLVKGPHGSMVLAPNIKVEEKLNIDSDTLKPNTDGVVIAYENLQHKKATN